MRDTTHSTYCDCTPGTYENGWHEQRGPACRAKELEAWKQMLERFDGWLRNAG